MQEDGGGTMIHISNYCDVECKICGRVGQNCLEHSPVTGHPNVEEIWLVCKCGHAIREIEER